jgi:hypothetical protein
MVDETKPKTEPTPEPTGEPASEGDGRDWKKLHHEAQMRGEAWKRELEDIKKAQDEAKAEKEQKELEAKGQYEAIVKKRDEELERLRANHAAEMLKRDLGDKLRDAGANNSVFIRGALAAFSGDADAIAEYVEGLKTDASNAAFFGQAKPAGQAGTTHGAPGARSNAKSLEERIADGDKEAINLKLKEMMGLS